MGTFLLLFLLAFPASGQNEGKWYNVEVLIFKRQTASLASENWQSNLRLAYPQRYQYLQSSSAADFSLLPKDALQLGGYNYTLRRSEDYRVLFHKAWKQQMQGKSSAPGIIISGGNTVGSNHKELEGYIKIHIARYLHVITDLWFALDDNPLLPAKPGSASPITENGFANRYSGNNSDAAVARFQESRRMRSKELHYIDHPLGGVLVLITPIE